MAKPDLFKGHYIEELQGEWLRLHSADVRRWFFSTRYGGKWREEPMHSLGKAPSARTGPPSKAKTRPAPWPRNASAAIRWILIW